MKLEKAIEILTLMGTPDFEGHTEDILAARKLGTEAMKREKANRDNPDFVVVGKLHGETEN